MGAGSGPRLGLGRNPSRFRPSPRRQVSSAVLHHLRAWDELFPTGLTVENLGTRVKVNGSTNQRPKWFVFALLSVNPFTSKFKKYILPNVQGR